MAHEQSETVQRQDGQWINIYGRNTPQYGKQLPDSGVYKTMEEAVAAAKKRSDDYGEKNPQGKKSVRELLSGRGAQIEDLIRQSQDTRSAGAAPRRSAPEKQGPQPGELLPPEFQRPMPGAKKDNGLFTMKRWIELQRMLKGGR